MSKQEKLAALLHRVQDYARGVGLVGPLGTRVKDAYREYANTPDDPPPRPEMPECVRELLDWCDRDESDVPASSVAAVRNHYAQTLRLEVGGVYQDAGGGQVKIVHRNPEADLVFCWLGYCGPLVCWYADDGKPAFLNRPPLIRQIS